MKDKKLVCPFRRIHIRKEVTYSMEHKSFFESDCWIEQVKEVLETNCLICNGSLERVLNRIKLSDLPFPKEPLNVSPSMFGGIR